MTQKPFHLWLALSPHGFGHAAMTAPVVREVRRRMPEMRLTIQTSVRRDFLDSRYDDFNHCPVIADFGFRMVSAVGIDLAASARDYQQLAQRFEQEVEDNAALMAADRPDLVLSNVAFVPLAAAARLGVPSLALSSLNWADMYAHYLSDRPEAAQVLAMIRQSYHSAKMFLRATPAQVMSLDNVHTIGPISVVGNHDAERLKQSLRLDAHVRVGLIAFGGIDHDLDLKQWPHLPGWFWLTSQPCPQRPDMAAFQTVGMDFSDTLASVDLVVTKPGYGTFSEAGMAGVPVLYVARPDWPESPHLDHWLQAHTQCLAVPPDRAVHFQLESSLQKLFSMKKQQPAQPTGIVEAADIVIAELLASRKSSYVVA